jgi:hypothetical protein
MRCIPIYCDICRYSTLADDTAIVGGAAACPECGASARSVPGASYDERDRKLYAEIVSALLEAGVTPLHAGQLLSDVPLRSVGAGGQTLRRITTLLPSLTSLEVLVDREPSALRKAEGMVVTLLGAIASSRSQSDIVQVRPGRKSGEV